MSNLLEALATLQELNPELRYAAEMGTQECFRLNLPFLVTSVYRSQAEQNRLWAIGRDKNGRVIGDVVTKTRDSDHTKRIAFDILPVGYPRMTQKQVRNRLEEIAKVFAQYGIIRPKETLSWGDYGHFDCKNARRKPIIPSPIPVGLKGMALQRWIDRRVERIKPKRRAERARERLESQAG